MRHHFRLMTILLVCVAAYAALLGAFHWMNQPRDSSVIGGLALIFLLLVIVPVVVHTIWRRI
jgi:heme/copper-type cytochrome/quinol oxidase subunit 4